MLEYVMFAGLGFVAGVVGAYVAHKEEFVSFRKRVYDRGYEKGYRDAKEIEKIFRDANL